MRDNSLKNNFKRIMTMISVCLLLTSMTAGCGNSNEKNSETTTSATMEATSAENSSAGAETASTSASTAETAAPSAIRGPNGEISEEEKQELIETAKGFLDNIVNGKYSECMELFDDKMKEALSESELIQAWNSVAVKVGNFESIVKTGYAYKDNYDVIIITSNHTSRSVVSTIVFSADKKVSGLYFNDTEKTAVTGEGDQEGSGSQVTALPDTVVEEDVTIGSNPKFPLKGRLTLPKDQSSGALRAVVLVHGSGPQDMDETIGANKPFRDIAWALAERGIAVLRYDKRTYSYGGTMVSEYGTSVTVKEETIDDAMLAKELLASDKRIDSGAVLVAGHSLGGMLAPRILDEGGFAGAVILAGSPRSLVDIVLDQIDYAINNGNYTEEDKMLQQSINETQYEAYKSLNTEEDEDAKDIIVFGMNGYYLKEMEKYRTEDYLKKVDKPILILQGTKDFQVSYENDFKEYQKLAEGHSNIQLKAYEGLNHLFMNSTMERPDVSEYQIKGTVDSRVTDDIANWVKENFVK